MKAARCALNTISILIHESCPKLAEALSEAEGTCHERSRRAEWVRNGKAWRQKTDNR